MIRSPILVAGWGASDGVLLLENNTISTGDRIGLDYEVTDLFTNVRVDLRNNVIAFNAIGVIDMAPEITHQHIFPEFNIYWGNTKGNFGELDPYYADANRFRKFGPGDICADPEFVNVARGDYHLLTGSMGIDSGYPEAQYNDPDGTRNDRGAYGGPALNTAPHAEFSILPIVGGTGTPFSFDAHLSHDGESPDDSLAMRWDFNGDGVFDTAFSLSKETSYRYSGLGTYHVVLEVKDAEGYVSTATGDLTVVNQAPRVPQTPFPAEGAGDAPIDLDLTWAGGDPDVDNPVVYDVYFGDTSIPPLVSSRQSSRHFAPGILEYGST